MSENWIKLQSNNIQYHNKFEMLKLHHHVISCYKKVNDDRIHGVKEFKMTNKTLDHCVYVCVSVRCPFAYWYFYIRIDGNPNKLTCIMYICAAVFCFIIDANRQSAIVHNVAMDDKSADFVYVCLLLASIFLYYFLTFNELSFSLLTSYLIVIRLIKFICNENGRK